MFTDPVARTLYDDWKARRERLAHASSGGAGFEAVEMRLLDYLLRRYQASPEVAHPARFPLPPTLFVNHRAIIVHHHLRQGLVPTISNEQEALAHVGPIVDRIRRLQSLSAADETGILDADAGVASCTIPPPADPVEAVRTRLCDSDLLVRIRAAAELGEIGDLDDVGLLSELLSLSACPEEHPRERESLLHAMKRLSGVTQRPFDLSGLLPVPNDPAGLATRGASHYFFLLLIILSATLFLCACITLALAWMDL